MMLHVILVLLVFCNLVIACSKKKSKGLIILSSIIVAFIFAGSRDMADWENYYSDYIRGDQNYDKNGQFLYYFLVQSCKYIGLTFDGFRFLISLIFLGFYYKFIFKYSQNPNLVYAAYLSYLIFLDDVQIRNFIACAVLMWGISIIIQHKAHWRVKFFFIVASAALIHNSFWIYLLYLFIPNNLNNDKFVKKIGFTGLIMTIIAVLVRPFISNIVLLFAIVAGDKATGYAETEIGLGGLVYVTVQILATAGVYYILKNFIKEKNNQHIRVQHTLKTFFIIDILSFVFLPTVILAMTFYRLIRNLFIINIVVFTYGIHEKKTRLLSSIILVAYVLIFAYFDLTSEIGQKYIIEPFFNNNIYF